MNETERTEIREALEAIGGTLQRAFTENDVELYLSVFDDDAITSLPGLPQLRGHAALREFFDKRPGFPPGTTFTIDPLEIEPLSADWGYAFGTDLVNLPNGKQETMTFMVLLRRTDSGWKTFREVVSPD